MTLDPIATGLGSARERSRTIFLNVLLIFVAVSGSVSVQAASLKGSRSSLDRQNQQAHLHDYSYLRTSSQVKSFAQKGYLIPVRSNGNFDLANVSFPYARPEVELFLNRLGGQYKSACGERMVVTSLTRPSSRQPRNASPLSVHPTGMAMDLRVPSNGRCRSWIESTLLSLEDSGVLEATREHRPPHYHVALYPNRYTSHVARITGESPALKKNAAAASGTYVVRNGDTLWDIARNYGISVASIKTANGMRGAMIKPGQKLRLP